MQSKHYVGQFPKWFQTTACKKCGKRTRDRGVMHFHEDELEALQTYREMTGDV